MLENLVVAVESEAQVVDIVRVAGFMQKVSLSFCSVYPDSGLLIDSSSIHFSGQGWTYIISFIDGSCQFTGSVLHPNTVVLIASFSVGMIRI